MTRGPLVDAPSRPAGVKDDLDRRRGRRGLQRRTRVETVRRGGRTAQGTLIDSDLGGEVGFAGIDPRRRRIISAVIARHQGRGPRGDP